jgi:sugar lactone lactonase YvrE
MKTSKPVVAFLVALSVCLLSLGGTTFAQPPLPGTLIASGFNGPQGVLVDPQGNVWVIDSGMGGDQTMQVPGEGGEMMSVSLGNTARIVEVAPDGSQTEVTTLPSLYIAEIQETAGGARLALLDGVLYATNGGWSGAPDSEPPALLAAVVRVDGETVSQVADMWAFESANNPDGLIFEAHPYGLAAGPDGWLWVADAGANALLRVNPATGEVVLVTSFGGLPGGFPNPNRNNAVEADPVPTGVAFDADGNAYVSLLSGAPFIPGNAKVLRVSAAGEVSDYATGLTTLTDLTRGPDGELYAVQFAIFTDQGPTPNSGALIRIKEGGASEVVVSDLPFPTSLSFDADGNVYVTVNGVGAPGSGAVIRLDGVTEMAGQPLPAMG